jgi:hypothetical protein
MPSRGSAPRVRPARPGRPAPVRQDAKRRTRRGRRDRSASSAVSTSMSSGSRRTRSPACCSRASCRDPVSGATSGRRAPGPDRSAQAEQPEAAVLGHAERGVRGIGHQRLGGRGQQRRRHLRGVHPDQHQRHRAGLLRVSQGPDEALVEAAPRWPMTSKPAGSQRPGVPSRASTRRVTARGRHRRQRIDQGGLGQSGRLAGVNGGVSRVLTRPGTGSLAITTTCAARVGCFPLCRAVPSGGCGACRRSGAGRGACPRTPRRSRRGRR